MAVDILPRGPTARHDRSKKPISHAAKWSGNKPGIASRHSDNGGGHAHHHPQFDLSTFPHGFPRWHGSDPGEPPMTEAAAALLAFLSVGIFLAHALDAYRTG